MLMKKQKISSSFFSKDKIRKYYLLNPGPVMVSEDVRNKLLLPDICHREVEFSDLYKDVSKKLNRVFKATPNFVSLVLTGSGTCAMEAIISSCVRNKVLCISNGGFGERWSEIISTYNIEKNWLKYSWGEYPKLKDIERILKEDDEIDSVVMVYSETSTGMLNPVEKVGKLVKKHNKLFLVDAISALAVDDVNVKRDNIDFCASSSHKGINSIPGLSIVCGKKRGFDELNKIKSRNFYCNLKNYYKFFNEDGQTPSTPSIQAFYSLDEALNILINEGVKNRIERTKYHSTKIREELVNLDFKLLLNDHFSNGVTSVKIPKKGTYEKIHNYLKKKEFIIYNGKGHLKNRIFQISVMGCIDENILTKFLLAIKKMKKDLKL